MVFGIGNPIFFCRKGVLGEVPERGCACDCARLGPGLAAQSHWSSQPTLPRQSPCGTSDCAPLHAASFGPIRSEPTARLTIWPTARTSSEGGSFLGCDLIASVASLDTRRPLAHSFHLCTRFFAALTECGRSVFRRGECRSQASVSLSSPCSPSMMMMMRCRRKR